MGWTLEKACTVVGGDSALLCDTCELDSFLCIAVHIVDHRDTFLVFGAAGNAPRKHYHLLGFQSRPLSTDFTRKQAKKGSGHG